MKTKSLIQAALLGLAGLLVGLPARGDLLSVAPLKSAMLPAQSDGATRVAFQFDLSALRSGEGRRIEAAILEWTVDGISDSEVSEFVAYPIEAPWTASGVAARTLKTVVGPDAAASWEITPVDHDRGLGGLIRLDVSKLVGRWAGGESSNYGVVVSSAGLSAEGLASQLSSARLTIYYGFVR